MTRYRVRLARPVFQVVLLDVEAEGRHEAVVKALSHAGRIPEEEWSGAFDPENYFYDAQSVQEMEEPGDDEDDDSAAYAHAVDRYTKYLLLKADTFSGDGEVLFEPWLSDLSVHMVGDLCADWAGDLERARDGGASAFLERLYKEAEEARRRPAKVIPLRRPPRKEE